MLNLLNRERRIYIRKEYLARLVNVFLLVIIFALFYFGVLLSSNLFLINFEKKIVEIEKNSILNSQSQKIFSEYESKITKLEEEYKILIVPTMSFKNLSTIINQKKVKGIFLENINFLKEGEVIKIDLKGIADTRETLFNYVNNFQMDQSFSEVNNPFSNFNKNSDISFTISMKFNLQQNEKPN
jgi:hypothetical protein